MRDKRKKKKSLNFNRWLEFFKRPAVYGIIIGAVSYGLLLMTVVKMVAPQRYEITEGDISPESIMAPQDVSDKLTTADLQSNASDDVMPIYAVDSRVTREVLDGTGIAFAQIKAARSAYQVEVNKYYENQQSIPAPAPAPAENEGDAVSADPEEAVQNEIMPFVPENNLPDSFYTQTINRIMITLSRDDILALVTAGEEEINALELGITAILDYELKQGVQEDKLLVSKNTIRDKVYSLPVSMQIKIIGGNISVSLIKANMLYDRAATEIARENAMNSVKESIYKKGQIIVEVGQPVNAYQIEVLRELGLLKEEGMNSTYFMGIAFYVALIVILMALWLIFFGKDVLKQARKLILLSSVFIFVLFVSSLTSLVNPYFLPVAMGGMLIAVLLNHKVALVTGLCLSLLLGFMGEGASFDIMLFGLITNTTAVYLVTGLKQRSQFVWAGLGSAVAGMMVIVAMTMVSSYDWSSQLQNCIYGLWAGLTASVATIGTLPVWENFFGIITPIKLMELSNPNQPVLKRLLVEAPGTYHHSILVANMAENAADAIGANALLSRIGAYYHDIGKLKSPLYFKENQMAGKNPHDLLDPVRSTRLITSHTDYGLDLARRYKVPKILRKFIAQHHGDTPMAFFYAKAKEYNPDADINDFRYSGPIPEQKEVALVMMADTVEAAIRSVQERKPDITGKLIRKLIKAKQDDGQFDNCDLTFKDLEKVAEAFEDVIDGIFHERNEYPELDDVSESSYILSDNTNGDDNEND